MADTIEIEILPDGTIKSTTGAISPANHSAADDFMAYVERLAGGTTEVKHKKGHQHTHVHSDQKEKA